MAPLKNAQGARLHHIQITAEDPETVAGFHARTLGLDLSRAGESFLCSAPRRRVLFGKGGKRGLGFAAFVFPDAAALDGLRGRLDDSGTPVAASPSPLTGKDAFSVTDTDGNVLIFDVDDGEDGQAPEAEMPGRLQHITLRSTNLAPVTPFYQNQLGFFLADTVNDDENKVRTVFFASDPEHHSLAVFESDAVMLDHHAYELDSWDGIKIWADHFSRIGIPLRWGPGRHGPGNNLFIFIEDPEGNWVEFSAELEVLDAERELNVWPHTPHSLNMWGSGAIMRS